MRIISGRFKRKKILTDYGKTTRPTTDYLREVIFSAIFSCVDDEVLDLFAGSGAIGLEALSRGAKQITFVDASHRAVAILKKNIENTRSSDECHIYKKEVLRFLKTCESKFSLIFLDPPYDKKLVMSTINIIIKNKILAPKGRIVIEHSIKEKLDSHLSEFLTFQKTFGTSKLSILENLFYPIGQQVVSQLEETNNSKS